MKKLLFVVAAMALCAGAAAQDTAVHVICSEPAEWCSAVATAYVRATGTRIHMAIEGAREALARLQAEKVAPKADVWFGGAGDAHLQAAVQGLARAHESPALAKLHPWAQQQARRSGYRTVGLYAAVPGFAYNPEVLARRSLPEPRAWADLLKPAYRGAIQMPDPGLSGAGYAVVATLVQRMGEDKAFDYLAALHQNVEPYTRTDAGPFEAVARGEAAVGVGFMHHGVSEKMKGFPVETVAPAEGTGVAIGAMSLVQGAPHPEAAIAFYEWALTPAAQELAAARRQFQRPSRVDARLDPRIPGVAPVGLVRQEQTGVDGLAARRRLVARWEKEVAALPR